MTNENEPRGAQNVTKHTYKRRLFPLTYTNGVRNLAQNCQAYWLIDVIGSHQWHKKVNCQPFQIWKLTRRRGESFDLEGTDGNRVKLVYQLIPFCDFPYDMATIWLVNGTLLLPNEY